MKKFTLVLFTLLTIITPPNAWGEEYVNNGVTYEYTPVTEGDGVATVKSVNTSAEAIEIPASFTITVEEVNHTYNITAITSNAFAGCSVLETLTIGDNVTSLSDNIFSDCTELRTLTIGNGITTITNKTFSGCTALRTLTLGTGITTINSSAFKDCSSLRTLTVKSTISLANLNIDFTHSALPNTLCIAYKGLKYYHQDSWSSGYFKVGDGSTSAGFDNTTKEGTNLYILETVCDIPVTTITGLAFKGVAPNFTIHIPSSITTISDTSFQENKLSSFDVDGSNANYKSINGVLFSKNGETLISYPIQKGDSYTVPDGVKAIGMNAFYKHEALTHVTFPNSLEKIEQSAFQLAGRGSTLNITFGTGLKTIALNAFRESGVSTIIFPEKLEEIGATAFYNSAQLTEVTFPASLKSIAASAFNECRKLTTLNFAASYETNKLTIGGSAFYNCKLQNTITLPEGVTTIGENAFNYGGSFDDSRIDKLYLPSSAVFSGTITQAKIYRKVNINFEGGKYTTYFSTMDLELPTGLTAYTITGVSDPNLTTTHLNYIHQGKAVLLELADGASLPEYYGIPSNETIDLDKNKVFNTDLFRGSTTATNLNSIHGDKYILSGDKFVKIAQGTLPAFRCYLVVDNEDIDNPADYYTFNEDGNSYVYKEEGEYIQNKTNIGSASLSVSNGNATGTLTVSPKDGFYTNENYITVIRSVKANSARAPQIDDTPITLTPTNANADPSGVTSYTFTHTDNATYEVTVDFRQRKNLSDNNATRNIELTLPEHGYTYDGQAKEPAVDYVTFKGDKVDSKNYDIAYTDNINAGSGIVTITGKREYMNTFSKTFPIAQRSITNVTIADIAPQTYTGKEIKPIESVTDIVNEENIIKAEDYEITYQNNINAGTAKVIVTAKDKNYTSVTSKDFTINPKNLTGSEDLKITDIPDQLYTGSAITPALEIKDGERILSAGTDYEVTYSNHTTVGTANVEITFKGNYTGSASTTFIIKETILERTLNVSFEGDNTWATYYWEDEYLTIPEGLKVYAVEGHEENSTTLNLRQLTTQIPKGVAVLLERTGDKKDNFVANTMSISTTLEEGVTPDATLFVGTKNGIEDLSTETGTKFVLVNDQFVQTTGGALPANRCYLNFGSDNIGNVNTITIDANTGADDFVYKVETVKSNAGGTATKSGITDGKVTITVTPNEGYFVEASNITVTRSVSASTSRAPSVDGGDVTVSAVDAEADPSGVTKYTFNALANSQYQVTIDFQKRIDFSKNKPTLTLSTTKYTYDGKAQEPEVTSVVCGGKTLTADDYEISYENNINAGTGKVWITGKRKYIGTDKNTTFSIQQRDINLISVVAIEDQIYNGTDITPTLTITDLVKIGDEDVDILDKVEGSPDYKVEFKNNKNVGTAQVSIVSNKVNYSGTKSGITFNILQKNLSLEENKPTIEPIDDQEYNGSELKPALVIKDGEILLVEGTDYDAVYDNNVDAGTATITITFKGNYTGTAEKTFTIVDPGLPREFTVNFDSDNEWTTYYATENLTLTGDLKAYVVTGINGLQVTTTEENEVKFIPKNTPVLLNSKSKGQTFNVKTCSGEKLPEGITPSPLFVGTTEEVNIASIEGTKFVLLNGKFIQAAEGTVAPNRCYLVVTDPIDVAQLTIKNGTVSNFIYQQDGTENNGIGTAEASTPKDGKVTLTVKPNLGYYINGKADITVVKNANAGSARAQQIDGGNVDVTEGKITDNADYTSTYEFTYPYETNCQYQITVNFHQATNIQSTKPTITFTNPIYNGLEQKVKPTVAYGEIILKEGEDYVLIYPGDDYTKAGTGKKVTVWGIRKYSKDLSNNSYSIEKRPISGIKPVAKDGQEWKDGNGLDTDNPQVYFSGSAMELNFTDIVKYKDEQNQDKELDLLANDNLGNEITVTYSNNTFVGNATATIKTKNVNYGGTDRQINFEILQKELKIQDVVIEDIEAQKYTGSEIKPALTIRYGEISLTEGEDKDYTVAYSNNINAGEATATITFHGNYTGSIEKKFTIEDAEETITINFDSDNEWTTYYGSKNLSLTETEDGQLLEAFVVTGIEEAKLNTTSVTFIPQKTPVLLHRISGTKRDFDVKTCSTESLDASIVPSDIFKGSLDPTDIATVNTDKIKFILLNGQFVQTTSETLGAGRCYIALDTPPAGVNTLTIGKSTDGIIILEEEAEPQSPSVIGTVNKATNGNITTLTVKANRGWYVETNDITVVRSTNASNGRAPLVDGNNVEITAGDITTENEKYSTTYLFTYPYSSDYSYQVKVNFHKSTELLKATTTITLDPDSYEYDKTVKQPQVTSVTVGDVTLTKDVDYVVTYPTEGNIDAGMGKVLINGIRKYAKELSPEFKITPRVIANHVTLKAKEGQTWVEGHELGTDAPQVIFTGSDIEVDVVDIVKDAENNETNIITADDYNITYNNNHKDASTTKVSITVSNKGKNYQGSKPFSFTILPKEMTGEDVKFKDNIEEFEYTGAAIEPEFTITYNGISLVNGTDYDVTFKNNVYAGEATATITFKGNYSGVVTKSFGIKDHLQPITVEFDNPDNQWNTYYYKENLTLPTDGSLKAYVVTGREGLEVNTKEMTFIPRNTAVLLFSESEAKKFELTTSYNAKLDEATESSIDKNIFIGTETGTDISTVTGTKFVLLNDKFIQAAEGTVAPNRCYLVVTEPIEGVTELTINKAGNAIIYQEDGKATTANLGTASTSEPKDGKVTLTVSPVKGYYVNGAEDITVVKNANATQGRAMQIDGGKVEVTAGAITDNKDYTSTYLFTYPFEQDCQYQITINFHKAANLSETGKYAVTFAPANYNGYEQKVEPTVTYDGATLKKDVDYMLTYPDADYTNAGKKTADIYGIRKFQNSLTRREFKIDPKNVNDITVETLEGQTWIKDHELGKTDAQVVYTGSEIKLNITDKIKDAEGHDVELLSAEQVDIIYKNNVNVGDASVTIKGKEVNYTGERPINYAIVAKEMTSEDIAAIPDQNYTGNEIKPALTIKYGNITLVEGEDKDYTVAYSNNINAGEATATVNFRGNYSGKDVKKTFKIVDVDETLTINFDSDNEWTTYYSSKNLTLTDNLKAYAVTGHNGKEVTTAELTFIPKETAVLLYSKSGEKTFNVETCSNETLPSDIVPDRNLFKGTLTNLNIASIAGTKFVLVDGQFVQTAEGTLAANRCYLVGSIEGVTTLTIGKGISEVITYEEGTETGAAGSARVITTPDENNNLTLVVTPKNGFYADQEHLKVVYSVNAGSARAPEVAGSEVALTPVEGYDDTSSEFRYTFPYTEGYFYQVTVNFQKCINLQAQGAQPTITLEEGTYVYDGTEKKPKIASVTIPVNGNTVTLTENKDFKVQEYQNNVNAGGTAKVIITGMNHYYNDYSKNFNIGQRDINLVKVEAIPDQTYTGQELTPALYVTDIVTINDQEVDLLNQIKDNGITIDDYTPEATDNINVGVAKVSLKATSINYTGIKSGITFNILPKDLNAEGNNPTIDPVENQYYTGEPLEPKLTIHDGELLIPEDDYEVVYSNNIKETTDATPAIADITFKGNYKGTAQTTFQIEFKSETKALNVDFGANDEWTTYYSPIDLKDVEGLNIFVVTGLNKGQGIDLKTEQVTFIPKNIGVLLQRTNKEKTAFTGQTMSSSTTLEGVTPDTDLFRGTSTGIEDMSTIDGVKYILVDDRFIQVVEGALPANRCYVFISNEEAEDIIHVDGDDANGIIIQEEGESSTTAGQVWVELRGDGYKHITVSPSSVTYATKDEIKVVRSIKNPSQASSRNRAPGIENTMVEVIPEYPNEDPSSTTHYKFEYDSDYNYQVTVNFQKRINLSDPNVSHPVVTLKAEDIQDLVYDGKPKTPAVEKVTCNGITVDPSNYDVSYENNTNAGRPRVIITGKRFLMGSTHAEFNIGKRNFSNVTVKEPIPDQEYNDGAPIVFKGLVLEDIVDGENIVQTTDYTIVCNDTEIGSAKVSFLPANNYEGSGKGPFSFNIIPATGINQIVIDEMEGQWFDLNGQRIEGRPTQKGVYILRDKKQRSIKVRIK